MEGQAKPGEDKTVLAAKLPEAVVGPSAIFKEGTANAMRGCEVLCEPPIESAQFSRHDYASNSINPVTSTYDGNIPLHANSKINPDIMLQSSLARVLKLT